jgi:hypothetical protein
VYLMKYRDYAQNPSISETAWLHLRRFWLAGIRAASWTFSQ